MKEKRKKKKHRKNREKTLVKVINYWIICVFEI